MGPGRKEISEWLDGWIGRYVGDPYKIPPEQLYLLVGSNLGWYWDVEDVGYAPSPWDNQPSAMSGMYKFLAETMAEKKRARAVKTAV
jgi:hypothetical protein